MLALMSIYSTMLVSDKSLALDIAELDREEGKHYMPGALGRIARILRSTFCDFRSTPDTLRADGLTVKTFSFQIWEWRVLLFMERVLVVLQLQQRRKNCLSPLSSVINLQP